MTEFRYLFAKINWVLPFIVFILFFELPWRLFTKMGGGGQQMMHLDYAICHLIKTGAELCKTIDDIAICFQMCLGVGDFGVGVVGLLQGVNLCLKDKNLVDV